MVPNPFHVKDHRPPSDKNFLIMNENKLFQVLLGTPSNPLKDPTLKTPALDYLL